MPNLNTRLTRLETRLGSPPTPWAALAAAVRRSQARARLKLCALLGVDPKDPRVLEAAGHLTHETAAQRQADEALMHAHKRPPDAGDVRARIMQRLDEMATRLGGGGGYRVISAPHKGKWHASGG
jgi:hypothetical protein